MKNKSSKAFILLLSVLFIGDLFDKTRAFSSYEKRPLASLPKWDLDALIDGSLTMDLEDYINDQFVGRDSWIRFKADLESWMGKTENNGILFGKDGHLFEKRLILNPQAELNLVYLSAFLLKYKDLDLTAMIVPEKDAILSSLLPTGFPMLDSKDLLDQWKTLLPLSDLTETLSLHKDENLFYKTDHHWTLKGAYLAYEVLMKEWGMEALPYESFSPKEVQGFLGTYFNKSRLESIDPENLIYIDPLIFSYETDGKTYESLIDENAFSGSDKYGAFLYGNHGIGHITVRESDSPKRLLVIKDSFANSVIPFMTSAFDEIDVIDLRHFSGSLENVLSSTAYDHVLVLQGFNQFCDEMNEAKLKY
jgi:hypothetical protein